MTDLGKTIAPKSDQMNVDDLIAGPVTITVTRVSPGDTEQPIAISYEGDGGKPYKPGKSMRRVLVQVWGRDGATYAGKSMTLYRDPDVKFGGMAVGGIRISHMTGIERDTTIPLTVTRGQKKPHLVRPLVIRSEEPALMLDEARALVTGASDIASLERAWKRRDMAPHRSALQPDLDARKAELDTAPANEGGDYEGV